MFFGFVLLYGDHRDLHVLTHSFATRRSSYLASAGSRTRIAALASPLATGPNAACACSRGASVAGPGAAADVQPHRASMPADRRLEQARDFIVPPPTPAVGRSGARAGRIGGQQFASRSGMTAGRGRMGKDG